MPRKPARLEVGYLPDPTWTRGPVLLTMHDSACAKELVARVREESLPGWEIESHGEVVAFSLEIARPEDETARIKAVLALGDVLVKYTLARPVALAEWAVLPSRRANRWSRDVAAAEIRLSVLRSAAAPIFDHIRTGSWPVADRGTFEAYHFALSVRQRAIIGPLINAHYNPPCSIYDESGLDLPTLDALAQSLETAGWLKLSTPYASQAGPTWRKGMIQSTYSADFGPMLARPRGPALRSEELIFDR